MKKDSKGLLKKKISELTLEDFAQLEKPLGTSTRPFPMWGPQRIEVEGRTEIETVLSVVANDSFPLKIYSERSYEEVMALAYCDMPVPSMLPLFKDGLERRGDPLERQKDILEGKRPQNENYNRTQMMIGDPGAGKSFMGALLGRLRSKGSIEIYDCGGKNMNDLLFEMVLDFGAGDALPKAIDKRLAAGALEPMSLALLKQLPAGVLSVGDSGEIESIDWTHLKTAGTADVQSAFETLKKISSVEKLDNAGGNALGMNSQYGALIRAYLENREIVLDEYNKSREGSDNALQTVIQFLIGELRDTTVENPLKNKDSTSGPSSFTFRREDMGTGFFVTFTGNKTEDGITTRSLNKSVYDRLKPDTLPDPDVIDWQHRICQMMVGMPVSTLYTVFRDYADKDPDGFGEWLMALRRKKAEVEGAPVPELQETLLTNWKNVVNSSENLAKFYDRWSKMTDATRITSNGNADLVEEVDDEYSKKEGMSFRRIKQHLEESIPIRARMEPADAPVVLDFKSWNKAPKLSEKIEENASLSFGTRLVEFIERTVFEKSGSVGKKKLYSKLLTAMDECALRDINLQEAARSNRRSVEEDLNISAFEDRDLNKQAVMARKVFCDYLRQVSPEITATDEQIIAINRFVDALKGVAQRNAAQSGDLFVANRDHETLSIFPVVQAVIKDAAIYSLQGKEELDFSVKDLVQHDDFIASLALPTVGRSNISAIWDMNIRPLAETQQAQPATPAPGTPVIPSDPNDGLLVSEGRAASGVALTSLQVLYDDGTGQKPVAVHIVRNTLRDKTLVVSEKAPSKLLAAFKEAGIQHVDRRDEHAVTKIEAALNDITRGAPPTIADRLVDAFRFRHDIDSSGTQEKKPQIAKLLADGGIDTFLPKYVVKTAGKPGPAL